LFSKSFLNLNLDNSRALVLISRVDEQIRILIFDDDTTDAELIRRALRRHNAAFRVGCVFTEQEYLAALRDFSPNVILSDYKLPLYGGAFALKMARELSPQVPFIFVSGFVQDELATELLQRGARAYASKSDLEQLGPIVERALAEAATRPYPATGSGAHKRFNPANAQS
jgi:CheY-like chemotaxis protein